MNVRPSAATRIVGLLGWPVAHSLSPVMMNAAFEESGLDLVYLALPTPPSRLHLAVEALETWQAVGANVTIPHKIDVMAHCDELTDEAELVGAVNTLAWTADGLVGHNTDAVGLGHVFEDELVIGAGERVVVLGTGGAARAVAVAAGRLGTACTVVGRRIDAAREVAALAELAGAAEADEVDLAEDAEVARQVEDARLVVNATPLGLGGEDLPAPFRRLQRGQIAYDLIYNPVETPFLAAARNGGADAHHGLGMLVAQAEAAYRTWTGQEAPAGVMSAAAMAALASN
ncbi:MAG: shikimate dehydrogenase [Nitriliruptorales bacterium]|nr:shikimate dehydrogenase [Nitriliruptorales bacterium]